MQPHIVLKPSEVISVTITQTASGLPDPPTGAVTGILTIEEADVRARWDGEDPTPGAGGGTPMVKNSVWEINSRDVFVAIRFVRNAATDAVVTVSYLSGG